MTDDTVRVLAVRNFWDVTLRLAVKNGQALTVTRHHARTLLERRLVVTGEGPGVKLAAVASGLQGLGDVVQAREAERRKIVDMLIKAGWWQAADLVMPGYPESLR